MVTMEQRQRLFKARIALALYKRYGRVPKTTDINRIYTHLRATHPTMLNPRLSIQAAKPRQQLVLF